VSDKFLKNLPQAGLYYLPQTRRSALETAAAKIRFHLLSADLAECRTTAGALQQLGSALQFPIWYGANFDALYDCLTDADWQPGKGHVLLINGGDCLRQAEPEAFATLIEVFRAAAEARREADKPFWILLDTPARGIATLPEA
jgi:RNAse (barnase) inhibitor barstar